MLPFGARHPVRSLGILVVIDLLRRLVKQYTSSCACAGVATLLSQLFDLDVPDRTLNSYVLEVPP